MYEYMTVEEIIYTMDEEKWFDLMTDCYIDEMEEEEVI